MYICICEHQRSTSGVPLYHSFIYAIGQDTAHIGSDREDKCSEWERMGGIEEGRKGKEEREQKREMEREKEWELYQDNAHLDKHVNLSFQDVHMMAHACNPNARDT